MRILLGIDASETYGPSVQMILGLGFPHLEVDLVHVIESVLPDASFPELHAGHPLSVMYKEFEEQADEILERAAVPFREAGVPVHRKVLRGDAARCLMEYADTEKVDLIVCRSSRKGTYGSLFFGSVSKGLVIGAKQSILVVKGDEVRKPPLRAVFATDHSSYCDRCVDLLKGMSPKGIGKLVVLTAFEGAEATAYLNDAPSIMDYAPLWIREKIEAMNHEVCAKLNLGNECVARVVDGHPTEAIRDTMLEEQAELLIMGAQGHGFFERVTLGSKSFAQVVAEPHSVLVLRPPA